MLGSPIRTPPDQRSVANSPGLIAGSHVLHRLLMPRHPPCALHSLSHKHSTKTTKLQRPSAATPPAMVTAEDALQAALKDARVHYPENKNHKPPPTPMPTPAQPAVTPATMTRTNISMVRVPCDFSEPQQCVKTNRVQSAPMLSTPHPTASYEESWLY